MNIKDREIYQIHAEICQALTHSTRLEIIDHLRTNEKTVSMLTQEMAMPPSTISRHLRLMREKGIVQTRRDGPNVYYQLSNDKIIRAYDLIHQFVIDHFNAQSRMLAMS